MTSDNKGHLFSATQAATACGVSRTTIVRKIESGDIAGATKSDTGAWEVPLSGLLAAGYRPGEPTPPEQVQEPEQPEESAEVKIARLEGEVALQRAMREAAERIADERLDRIGELRRALMPPPQDQPEEPEQPEESTPPEPAPSATETAPQPAPAPEHPTPPRGRLRRIWHTIID